MQNYNKVYEAAERFLNENDLIRFKYYMLERDCGNIYRRIEANIKISKYIKRIKNLIELEKKELGN